MSNKVCCVRGCSNSAGSKDALHKFPNPSKDKDRFNTWVYFAGSGILGLGNDHIFKYRRICHKHFEEKYWCRNNLLSNIAVPTKNMPGSTLPTLTTKESFRPLRSIQNVLEASSSKELELEYLDNSCLDVADIPPHHSESDLEDDEPLMVLKTEVEDLEDDELLMELETEGEVEEVSKKKRRVRDTKKLELENLDNSRLDVADIPPHYSESDLEDYKPLMVLKTEVEDLEDDELLMELKTEVEYLEDDELLMELKTEGEVEEVSKKKRRVRDTKSATVAEKLNLDTKRTKLEDAITAEQTKKEKSESKVLRTTQKRTSKPGTYFKETYKM